MAFYYCHGNQSERIETHKNTSALTSGSGTDEQNPNPNPPSPIIDDDSVPRRSTATGGRRRERIGGALRKGRTGAPRRDLRLGKILGEQQQPPPPPLQQQSTQSTQPQKQQPQLVLFNSEGRVSYGTWRGLIMYLTQAGHTASDFSHTFFLVFRSFATPSDLAEALVARARESPTTKLTPAETKTWNDRVQAPIRRNVFLAIKTWFENYWYSADDGPVLGYLCSFLLNEYLPTRHGSSAKECHKLLRRIESKSCIVDLQSLAEHSGAEASPALLPGGGSNAADSFAHHDVQPSSASVAAAASSQSRNSRSAQRQPRQPTSRQSRQQTRPLNYSNDRRHSTDEGVYLTQAGNARQHDSRRCRKGLLNRLFFRRCGHSLEVTPTDSRMRAADQPLRHPFRIGDVGLEPIDDDDDGDNGEEGAAISFEPAGSRAQPQDGRPPRAPT
ncbi:hypothetical protein GGI00_004855, partial [Coemansia sp. RSA 2681]